jgi:hypothetical protein
MTDNKVVELWGGPCDGSHVTLPANADDYRVYVPEVGEVTYEPVETGDLASNTFRWRP